MVNNIVKPKDLPIAKGIDERLYGVHGGHRPPGFVWLEVCLDSVFSPTPKL